MSENKKKYYIGIDLGGTFIKGGIVDEKGSIVVDDKIPTESEKGGEPISHILLSLWASIALFVSLMSAVAEA